MKTRISAAIVAAALGLATAGAQAQYVVRSGSVVSGTYSYGSAGSLGYRFPTYVNGYYAGPAPATAGGFAYSSAYAPAGMAYPTTINSVAPGGSITVASVNGTYIPPYNYTVVGSPYFARHYVGYGSNDFPFYGRIYGRPYDAWSWTYLGGGYYNALARYYYPPVR
jgi:hypothetical protein